MLNIGLLILRIVLGVIFLGHGSQKLFGFFGGSGLKGTTQWIGSMGLRPAWFWGWMASLSEFAGGLLLVLGFLSPLGSLGIIASMLVAIIQVHFPHGFWNTKGGIEFPLTNIAAALALAFTGPGAYSLDAALGITLPEPALLIVGLVAVILAIALSQVTRARAPGA